MRPDRTKYEVDRSELLFFCPVSATESEDRTELARVVVLEQLQQEFLHHYHACLEGGHQGIGRTYQRIRASSHWRGLYRSVQWYVGEYVDRETGKDDQVVGVDHLVICNRRTRFRL